MSMTQEDRTFLEAQLTEKHQWFDTGSKAWSFAFNSSLAVSVVLSATAAAVVKINYIQSVLGLSDAAIKDVVAIVAALATLVTALAAGGGFGRKWQANRVSRGRIDRLRIKLSAAEAVAEDIRKELIHIIEKHDEAIIGASVK